MKLLTPTEVRTSNQSEVNKNLVRVGVIRDALQEVERKLNDSEARFDATLARQRAIWEAEKAKHIQEISDLESEINTLKKQREVHLIPIELDRKKAHDLLVEADEALSEARERNRYVEDLKEILEGKLDEVSERDEDLKRKESLFALKSSELSSQTKKIDILSKSLTDEWEKFFAEKKLWDEQKSNYNAELAMRLINLEARESMISERKTSQDSRERALNDKYETLIRTAKRWQTQKETRIESQP